MMFPSESEARIFARAKLAEGLVVFAGTVNPVAPKKLILGSKILDWVNEGPDGPAK